MTTFSTPKGWLPPYIWVILSVLVANSVTIVSTAEAQEIGPAERIEALDLDTMKVGRVTVHFVPADRSRAKQLAVLAEESAAFFERELGIIFELGIAALAPEDWFSEFPGIPYAIPWYSMSDRLIFMPSSLEEGLLIYGPDGLANRRRVDFVQLHEYGHIAAKEYFRPADEDDFLPVKWFEELVATYFAYAFVQASDPEWAEQSRAAWLDEVQGYAPSVVSLDWSFMNSLASHELSRTYAWYQFMLNLRASEIYDQHGLGFLRALRERLPWHSSGEWSTSSLLPLLEEIAPGFQAWEKSLPHTYGSADEH